MIAGYGWTHHYSNGTATDRTNVYEGYTWHIPAPVAFFQETEKERKQREHDRPAWAGNMARHAVEAFAFLLQTPQAVRAYGYNFRRTARQNIGVMNFHRSAA